MNETFRFMPNAHIQPFSCFEKNRGSAKLPSAFFLRPLSYDFQKFFSLNNKKMVEYLLKIMGSTLLTLVRIPATIKNYSWPRHL